MLPRAISINKKPFGKPIESSTELEKSEHVQIQLFLPPTDVPNFITPKYDPKQDIFSISFNYATDEEPHCLMDNPEFSLNVGKQSGKVISIQIKQARLRKINKITLERIVNESILKFVKGMLENKIRERNNLLRAGEAIKETASELSESAQELMAV